MSHDIDNVPVGRSHKESLHTPHFGGERVHYFVAKSLCLCVCLLDVLCQDGDNWGLWRGGILREDLQSRSGIW